MTIKELKKAISKMQDDAKVMLVDGLNIREDIVEIMEPEIKDFENGLVELRAVEAEK